ncbi:hypothetical protein TRICI_002445 [Trichomonascus ciferrii]|uniref:CNH domain-containing protein n=1 Tax=Trichomonascus ciferrii TaxID=44093 RepID=A0A642VC12_9ASCO|nr:hypothetical protein TRICI_002445 [Trichomonascus ciferrii]
MIQAFEAKGVVSDKGGGRIEALHAFGDRLLVGYNDGGLKIYRVRDPFSADGLEDVELVSTRKGFSKRGSIEQLEVVKDAGAIFALAGGSVHVFDLESYAFAEQLRNPASAGPLATIEGVVEDGTVTTSRVAIVNAKHRRVSVYEWQDSEFVGVKEVAINDRAKSVCFVKHDILACGLSTGEIVYVNVSSGDTVASFTQEEGAPDSSLSGYMSRWAIGAAGPPMLCRVADRGLLAVAVQPGRVEGNVVLLDSEGQKVGSVNTTDYINMLGYCYPYLVVIYGNGTVEFRNIDTGSVMQRLEISGENSNIKLLNDGKLLYVANESKVYRLLMDDFSNQVDQLATQKEYTEAISLLSQIEPALFKQDKEQRLKELKVALATDLFHEEKYVEAMDIFSEVSAPPEVVISLYPEDLNDASLESLQPLRPFLADTRRKISSLMLHKDDTDSDILESNGIRLSKDIYGDDLSKAAELVDTTLFRCYLRTTPSLVGSLVRVHNHCDPKVVQEQLTKRGRWKELVDFYHNKSLHRDALQLLKSLATNEETAIAGFDGPEATVAYLEKLDESQVDLIFEFARWPISLDKEYGIELFVEDVSRLPKLKVLDFLKSLNDEEASCYLCLRFLEALVYNNNDETPSIHNSLALTYITCIKKHNESEVWDSFMSFIESSQYYRPDRVLLQLPHDDPRYLPPRAILYGKRGEHKRALEIYAFEMNDPNQASQYCAGLYQKDPQTGQSCLHKLLSLYLEKGSTQYHDAILNLLSTQGSRMSVIEVLNNLPSDIKIADINSFLQSQIRALHSSVKSCQLEASLSQVHLVRTQESLLQLNQRHTVVTNLKTCKVCNKRLGHSVISIFPDEVVVHYGCARAYKEQLEQTEQKFKSITVNDRQTKSSNV